MSEFERGCEEVSAILSRVADFLEKQDGMTVTGGVTLRNPDFAWVASCLKSYVEGEKDSLDKAFGLKRGRGEYNRPLDADRIAMVEKALWDLLGGRPLKTVAELNGHADKDFRLILERYTKTAIERMAQEITVSIESEGA